MKTKPLSRRIAFLGDYVPRRCGIATFTHSLFEAVDAEHPDADCSVAAVSDRPESYDYPPQVRIELQQDDLETYRAAGREIANRPAISPALRVPPPRATRISGLWLRSL